MDDATITKPVAMVRVANMADYDHARSTFGCAEGRALFDGLPKDHINIAHEAVDRHVVHNFEDQIALRWIAKSGDRTYLSFRDLRRQANRFANVLRVKGIKRGDKVDSLLGRVPELLVAAPRNLMRVTP